jgi:signal transduction histidine kinase/CheY-like chemotaxis protein/HPt (histidine-containing phosphotransfer) domain-containing protein
MFRIRSIRTKLTILGTATILIGVIISTFFLGLHAVVRQQISQKESLVVTARVVALNCRVALENNDIKTAQENMNSLIYESSIESATLINEKGKILASHHKLGYKLLNFTRIPETAIFETSDEGEILISIPIVSPSNQNKRIGAFHLKAQQVSPLNYIEAWGYSILTTLVIALMLAGIPIYLLHKGITKPILELADTAEQIAFNEDYSIRVSHSGADEIGKLYERFNDLLEQVNISESLLKATQRDLIREKNNAEQANKTKSEFLANMSHEIRTPLTGILGFTDLLLANSDEDTIETRIDYLKTIRNSGKHLLNLINDILDLSKIESGQMTVEKHPCSPVELIKGVYDVLKVNAGDKGLKLEFHWVSPIPRLIFTDSSRFRQILLNLVGNSIKFTQEGGVVILSRIEHEDGHDFLYVDVIDTGIGITPDQLTKLFQSFVQADTSVTRRFGGTGLGLAISRRLARLMGGDITVRSKIGEGSAFTLKIDPGNLNGVERFMPNSPQIESINQEQISPEQRICLKGRHILLVEDGETNRKLISLVLKRAGAQVTMAENGLLGVQQVIAHADFDLIFMDMQMPVMDGYTASSEIRTRGYRTPIVALTAHAMSGDRQKCIDAGCTDYLTKPIDTQKLLALTQQYLPVKHSPENNEPTRTPVKTVPKPVAKSPTAVAIPKLKQSPIHSMLPVEDDDFRDIVEEFVDKLQLQIKLLRTAIETGDTKQVNFLAHWLKGAGGTAGFEEFTKPAHDLELAAKSANWDHVNRCMEIILNICRRIELPWKVLGIIFDE